MTRQGMTERKVAREDQLLETALRLFKDRGYHSTSMPDLADALGMQNGGLDYCIDRRVELLRRLLEQATSFLAFQIDEVYAGNRPPADKLCWALENHALATMAHMDLVSVYLQEYRNLPPGRLDEILAVPKDYEQVLMQILEDGIALGEFRLVNFNWVC